VTVLKDINPNNYHVPNYSATCFIFERTIFKILGSLNRYCLILKHKQCRDSKLNGMK